MDESMVSAGIDLYLGHTNETDTIPMADGTEIDITPMAQKPIVLEFVLFGFGIVTEALSIKLLYPVADLGRGQNIGLKLIQK